MNITLIASRIILTILILYSLTQVWTKNVDLILWSKKKISNLLPISDQNGKDPDLIWLERQKIPMTPDVLHKAINRFLGKERFRKHQSYIELSIKLKDGSDFSGVCQSHGGGGTKQSPFRYDILLNDVTRKTIFLNEIDIVNKFEIEE